MRARVAWEGRGVNALECAAQTYVFFHLQQLTHMDTIPIPEEGKQLAEATYMKKKMYYNMRIKTLKRNTTNILRKGREVFNGRKSQATETLTRLVRQAKDLERELELEEKSLFEPEAVRAKIKMLEQAVETKTREVAQAEEMHAPSPSLPY